MKKQENKKVIDYQPNSPKMTFWIFGRLDFICLHIDLSQYIEIANNYCCILLFSAMSAVSKQTKQI